MKNEVKEEDKIIHRGPEEWLIKGDCSFYHIQDRLGLKLIHNKRILTMGGYLIEKLGEIPEEGTTIKLPEGTYIIGKVNQNRIEEVVFRQLEQGLTAALFPEFFSRPSGNSSARGAGPDRQ